MPQNRVTMRKIREILRLAWSCKQTRKSIADSCGIGKTTVTDTLYRASAAGLSWPLPSDLDDELLESVLYPLHPRAITSRRTPPDWASLHNELLTHKNLTLMLLWQEYKEREPSGYQYSQFCDLFRYWRGKLDLSMRQEHRAGEKMFVDYCGQTLPIVDPATGEIVDAQVFVRTFSFFGAVPHCIVPDNLLSGVTKPCRYEPGINQTYQEMATHYGTAVIPARVRKPRDKPKVEAGVQFVQRFILAGLRHRTFFSLAEANAAIRERLELLNNRPFRKLPGTRKSRFEELDRPAMLPLPELPYQFAQWKVARVHIDYHVDVEGHFYSVPYRLVREQVDVRYTSATVECFHKGKRIASHPRSFVKGKFTTNPEHMPPAHLAYADCTPGRLISWASQTGKATTAVVESILSRRAYPEHGVRSCMGILSLGKRFGKDRLEAACERALFIRGVSYTSIKSILQNNLDQKPLPKQQELFTVTHDNIRGTDYYG